jgi:hypothetical protein
MYTTYQNTGEIHKKDIFVLRLLLYNRRLRRIFAPQREEETEILRQLDEGASHVVLFTKY